MTGTQTAGVMERPFALDLPQLDGLKASMWSFARGAVEQLLDFPRLNRLYGIASAATDIDGFLDKVIERLEIEQRLDPADLARIPKTGPKPEARGTRSASCRSSHRSIRNCCSATSTPSRSSSSSSKATT